MALSTLYRCVERKEESCMLVKNHLHLLLLSFILVILSLLVAGCWDRKEIENRGFVLGIAIDHVENSAPKGQYDLPHVTQEAGQRKYKVTVELPKLQKQEGEKSASNIEPHYLFTSEGESMVAIVKAIQAKTYFNLFFEDIQVIIFSESVAREGVGDLLDFFLRNPSMRRQVKMFVTPGRAEDILKNKLQVAEVNSLLISRITKNSDVIPRFPSMINLGNISEALQKKQAFYMSGIVAENNEVKLTKVEVFNTDKKLVGEMNEWEIIGGKIIKKMLKGGYFSIFNPANPDKLAAFELLDSRVKVNSYVQGDQLWFNLEAHFIGNLAENTEPEQKATDPAFNKAMEEAFAAEFTRQVQASYHTQQEMKADILGLGDLVQDQHPDYWNKVKDHWDDEVFPTLPLDIKIKVVIRRPGMTL